jgi:ribosomal protein S10
MDGQELEATYLAVLDSVFEYATSHQHDIHRPLPVADFPCSWNLLKGVHVEGSK